MTRFLAAAAAAFMLAASAIAQAQLHDQGMTQSPVVRTDYAAKDAGTAANPLRLDDCLWGGCRDERLVFDESNAWSRNWPCRDCASSRSGPAHWTVVFNNEPRADPANPGPPDVSLPRSALGRGIMGFDTLFGSANLVGDARWRAHLALDFVGYDNPVVGAIPFLGFGDFSRRATDGRPLAVLRPSDPAKPSLLAFGERLWDVVPPVPIAGGTQPAVLASWVWIAAEWAGAPRAIFLTLYHYNLQNSKPPAPPATYRWNWPFADSVFDPGADIVYIDAEDVESYCGFAEPLLSIGTDTDYRIDLTRLFSCADALGLFAAPMPDASDIPVTSVLWANEATGVDGGLWVDVHDPRMLSADDPDLAVPAVAPDAALGSATSAVAARIFAACAARPGCGRRHAIARRGGEAALELPFAVQPSMPALRRDADRR